MGTTRWTALAVTGIFVAALAASSPAEAGIIDSIGGGVGGGPPIQFGGPDGIHTVAQRFVADDVNLAELRLRLNAVGADFNYGVLITPAIIAPLPFGGIGLLALDPPPGHYVAPDVDNSLWKSAPGTLTADAFDQLVVFLPEVELTPGVEYFVVLRDLDVEPEFPEFNNAAIGASIVAPFGSSIQTSAGAPGLPGDGLLAYGFGGLRIEPGGFGALGGGLIGIAAPPPGGLVPGGGGSLSTLIVMNPEPSSLALFGLALAGALGAGARRRRRRLAVRS